MNSSRLKSASSVCWSAAKWTAANWSRSPSFSRQNCDTCANPLDFRKFVLVELCVMKRSSHQLTAVEPIGDIENAITTLLRYIGEDPSRDGLRDTPARVARAWREMTSGYDDDPAAILGRTFDESSDEMIILRGISLYWRCEDHLLL